MLNLLLYTLSFLHIKELFARGCHSEHYPDVAVEILWMTSAEVTPEYKANTQNLAKIHIPALFRLIKKKYAKSKFTLATWNSHLHPHNHYYNYLSLSSNVEDIISRVMSLDDALIEREITSQGTMLGLGRGIYFPTGWTRDDPRVVKIILFTTDNISSPPTEDQNVVGDNQLDPKTLGELLFKHRIYLAGFITPTEFQGPRFGVYQQWKRFIKDVYHRNSCALDNVGFWEEIMHLMRNQGAKGHIKRLDNERFNLRGGGGSSSYDSVAAFMMESIDDAICQSSIYWTTINPTSNSDVNYPNPSCFPQTTTTPYSTTVTPVSFFQAESPPVASPIPCIPAADTLLCGQAGATPIPFTATGGGSSYVSTIDLTCTCQHTIPICPQAIVNCSPVEPVPAELRGSLNCENGQSYYSCSPSSSVQDDYATAHRSIISSINRDAMITGRPIESDERMINLDENSIRVDENKIISNNYYRN